MSDFGDLFGNPDPGRRRRDEGMARVAANNRAWMVAAIGFLQNLPSGRYLPEEWRYLIEHSSVGKPTHPNIYGHLTKRAEKLGIIRKSGSRRQMAKISSHARTTDEYVKF